MREKDPSTEKILEGGSSQRYMFSVFSLHAKGSTCPQLQDLAERQEDPGTRKILTPCKLPSLGRSQYQGQTRQNLGRDVQWLITVIQAVFRFVALPRPDYCHNSAERQLSAPVKIAEGPNLLFFLVVVVVFFLPPAIFNDFNSFSILLYLESTRTEISAGTLQTKRHDVTPSRILIVLGSSYLHVNSQ